MTLMLGTAPFGRRPAGTFNFDVPGGPIRYLEACPRRVRGVLDGETVIDSRAVRMLHESGYLAVWAFPEADARLDRLGDRVRRRNEPELAGLIFVEFDDLDEWYEEDDRVRGHARDPFSRIDVLPSSRHVRVSAGGTVLAESARSHALFETGLPTRWYLPRPDVRMDLLAPSAVTSRCAYKGVARFWDAPGEPVLAWSYEDPLWDAERVRDLVCFFNERVDLEVDGQPQERPRTPWSSPAWADVPQRTGGRKDFG